tara:strand:- start:310 stop:591 length:282 start_codon:yes stop_codon:yes gene_type:complete
MASILNENITADGNTSGAEYPGGEGYFILQGTEGGGTFTLQFSGDNGTTYSAVGTDSTLTASGGAVINLPPCLVRVNTSGSTGADVDAKVVIY